MALEKKLQKLKQVQKFSPKNMKEFESTARYALKFTLALDILTGNFCQNFPSKNYVTS